MRDVLHAGEPPDPLQVGERQRLDQAGASDHHQAVGAGDVDALPEARAHRGQQAEQEHRHRERADRERRADLLALQVGEEQRQVLHDATSALPCPASTSTPFSRCRSALARSAARGSWVTIRIVLPRSETSSDKQVQDLVGALAVEVAGGLVAQQEGRVGHDRARDRDALLLPARELTREVVHAVLEAHDPERRLDVLAPLRLRERREQQRQLDVPVGR